MDISGSIIAERTLRQQVTVRKQDYADE